MSRLGESPSGFGRIFDLEEKPPTRRTLEERIHIMHHSMREERADFMDWSKRVPEPKSGSLDFKRFPFQVELYNSAYEREIVVKKSTQVGVSAYLVRWCLFFADTRAQNALYIFPKERQLRDFCIAADERVLMADGTVRRIADVRVGDRVLSSDGERVVPDVVTATCSPGVKPLLRITLAGGRRMRVTAEHHIFTKRGWLDAADVAVGDEVAVADALPASAGSPSLQWRRVAEIAPDGHGDTRDLTTEKHHAFFLQGGLTHNSDARIRPLILGSDYLRTRVPGEHVNNKGLKEIGLGYLYCRGSESIEGLESIDADVLALDEYDKLTQEHIPDAERRLSGSLDPKIRRIGTPTYPGIGLSAAYATTDQRQWRVKCEACNEWQAIDFWENLNQERLRIECSSCHKPLDVRRGEWVATYPDRDIRGYHIPRLIVPGVDLATIVEESKATDPWKRAAFFNKDLGLEYADAEGRLSPQVIASAQRPDVQMVGGYMGDNLVTMGVDVASARALNVRISENFPNGQKKALWIGEVEWFGSEADCPANEISLALLMRLYNVNMACIDHLPEGRMARAFVNDHAGRAYLVRYTPDTSRLVFDVDESMSVVKVKRVEALDATMEMIRTQTNILPSDLPEGYVQHMTAAMRVVDQDDKGKVKVQYIKQGPDDYLHAECYDMCAAEAFYARQRVQSALEVTEQPLDDLMHFQRSTVDQWDDMGYAAGPDDTY